MCVYICHVPNLCFLLGACIGACTPLHVHVAWSFTSGNAHAHAKADGDVGGYLLMLLCVGAGSVRRRKKCQSERHPLSTRQQRITTEPSEASRTPVLDEQSRYQRHSAPKSSNSESLEEAQWSITNGVSVRYC